MKYRFIYALGLILVSTLLWASPDDTKTPGKTMSRDSEVEECYCSVRKRQQVERRLKKKKQLEQE